MNDLPAHLLHNRMTEAEFDAAWAEQRERYGDSSVEAAAKRDQGMGLLFDRSGWTQEELAARIGKSQDWVSLRLRFGRFLHFTTVVVKRELPPNLTEGRFRKFWTETDPEPKDEYRFSKVLKLMTDEPDLLAQRPKIAAELKARFSDGKWRRVPSMAERIEAPQKEVFDTLIGMFRSGERGRYGCKAEKRGAKDHLEFRLIKLDKMVSLNELVEKFEPSLRVLEAQGKQTHAVHYAPSLVLEAVKSIRNILDELAQ